MLVSVGDIRRRQVDQPLGIAREATHHLERGDGVLLANSYLRSQPGVDQALADDVRKIEHIILGVLKSARGFDFFRKERTRGFVVGAGAL